MEPEDSSENLKSSISSNPSGPMTLQKAIEMGEYDVSFLSTFPEWYTLSRHVQIQYIKQAMNNRQRQLDLSWAEIVNVIDFSKKPHLKEALKNIEERWKKLRQDKEILYTESSKG